ncbi:uncharacterized protein LOC117190642 [Drosophila miranda]|uniref:uncharacterized protein LOC117190642 n=1 Tax=Drosophila miranda TaxID=7229 RepID=UPI00143F9F77|nr:uncharacterized protein LOC117190642 [Drosophila miranda]
MSDLVGTEEFSAAQLREWLEYLNLPKGGSKAAMAARLNEIPVELRGQGPPAAETCENEREDEAAADQDSTKSERKEKNEKAPQAPGHNNNHGEYRAEVEMLKLQIVLLKLQSEREKEGRGENTTPAASNDAGVMLLNAAKDMLPTYHGNISGNNDDVTTWIAQFKAVAKVNKLKDEKLLMLLMSKLKDKALVWLHSSPEHMSLPIDQLLNVMEDTFHPKESKLLLRRKFESRSWARGEEFSMYFNAKVSLASRIVIDDEEFIDGVIEGIPDVGLRRQAHMQCFGAPYQLLKAFEKIMLPKKYGSTEGANTGASPTPIRCYNCNSLGHVAGECRKPKRERGACYGCGSMSHQVSHCDEKKYKIASSTQGAQ